jgi:outer membrane protein assembly factor BamD
MAERFTVITTMCPRMFRPAVVFAALLCASACASSGRGPVPPGTARPDQYLFERGSEALKEENWLTAREFFRQVNESFTQSPYRPEAKLGIGDTYLGEGTAESLVLAINEFQEFLSYYPTSQRADYAQYKLAMAYYRQMRAPQRDQTETRNAIREFEAFITRYPNSSLLQDVQTKLREARDRVGQHEFEVGRFYYRLGNLPGAIDRLQALLKQDPDFTRRDSVYFYLGETLVKGRRPAEALPYYERLVKEFEQSEHLEDARKRIAELKNPAPPKEKG